MNLTWVSAYCLQFTIQEWTYWFFWHLYVICVYEVLYIPEF